VAPTNIVYFLFGLSFTSCMPAEQNKLQSLFYIL